MRRFLVAISALAMSVSVAAPPAFTQFGGSPDDQIGDERLDEPSGKEADRDAWDPGDVGDRRQSLAEHADEAPDHDLNWEPDTDRDEDDDVALSDSTFFELYDTKLLHRETRDYVPKLIAAALIAKEPERYGFTRPDVQPLVYDSIVVTGMVGLDVVARLADTTLAAIRDLNRQYIRLATPPSGTWVVRVPSGLGAQTAEAYAKLPPNRRVTTQVHLVKRGEVLGRIARKYGVSIEFNLRRMLVLEIREV